MTREQIEARARGMESRFCPSCGLEGSAILSFLDQLKRQQEVLDLARRCIPHEARFQKHEGTQVHKLALALDALESEGAKAKGGGECK